MSRTERIALVALGAVLVAAGVVLWWTTRPDEPAGAPIPGAGEARVVVADPSIDLPYLVEVPRTADGCPAAAFRSPAEPLSVAEGNAGIMLPGGHDGAVLTACIGAVADVGALDRFVADVWSGEGLEDVAEADVWERLWIERIDSPLGDALAVTSRVGARLLTDHYVERDGWIYAVGYLRPEASGDADRAVVDGILASWQWR